LRNVDVQADGAAQHASLLADLVGLAVPPAKGERTLNLLPASIGDAQAFAQRQPWFVAAGVALLAALALPGLHYQSVAAAARQKTAEVEQALRPLQSLQSRNTENLARLTAAQREIEALHDLVETKNNWINFFTDLQDRLGSVDAVWLEKLQVVRPAATATTSRPSQAGLFGGGGGGFDEEGAPTPPEPLRLNVSGRLLDRANPVSRVSQASYDRVKSLLASFKGSTFINAVENERFNSDTPGILEFEFILVVNPKRPL
jgi:type IV pilus assembly protein PilM